MARLGADYPLDYTKTAGENPNDRLHETADTAGKVTEQAREYGEKAQEAVRQAKPRLEKSLREQPLITLAGVAALGFVLGALWKK